METWGMRAWRTRNENENENGDVAADMILTE